MKGKGYPEYIDSGNDWVGTIPKHWKYLRADFATTSPKLQVSQEEMEGKNVLYYSIPNVQEYGTAQVADGTEIDSSKLRITMPQLLISKLNPRKATLCIAQPHEELLTVCSGEFISIVPEAELDLQYCYYAWLSDKVTKLLSSRVQSVTRSHQRVEPEEITKLHWAWPPLSEQRQIAAFLDWKTGQIDALFAKKKLLLERLKEKRMAVITQAVTKGLNPDANMRESGHQWLGEVASHWDVRRLKFIATVGNGSTPDRDDPGYWEGGDYPWLNSSVVNQETVTQADQFVTALALKECHLPKVQPPAILIGITGQGRTRGMATTLLFEATINQHIAYVRTNDAIADVGFVRRVFDMAYAYLRSESDGGGSTKGALTCEQIEEMPIPIPPLQEQVAIVNFVDREVARIARMIEKVESAIDRLIEYRSALITNATTGKIDVRHVKPAPARTQPTLA